VSQNRITTNPAARLRLPAPGTHRPQAAEQVLTEDELQRLFARGSPSLRVETMLRAAGEAGLRRSRGPRSLAADGRALESVGHATFQIAGSRQAIGA
jgi:hypothetical protein